MNFRAFVGIAFVLNLLLSNVCLMGTAYAAVPVDGSDQILSREVPMSFNVVTCTWIKTDDGWEPTADSPCAGGHCLKKEQPDTRCVTAHLLEIPAAQLPTLTAIAPETASPTLVPAFIAESPPPYPGLGSTVMLL